MNNFKFFLSLFFTIGMLFSPTILAEDAVINPQKIDEAFIIELAERDGSYGAQAAFCKLDDNITNDFIDTMYSNAKFLAEKYAPKITLYAYKDAFDFGLDRMHETLARLPREGENYNKNCSEVAQKIQQRIERKFE